MEGQGGGAGRGEKALARPDGEPLVAGWGEAWGRNPGLGSSQTGPGESWGLLQSRQLLAGSPQAWRPSRSAMEAPAGPSKEGLGSCKYSSRRPSPAGTSRDALEGKGRQKLFKMVVTMTFNLLDVSRLVELFTGDLRSGKSPDTPGAPARAPGEASLWVGVDSGRGWGPAWVSDPTPQSGTGQRPTGPASPLWGTHGPAGTLSHIFDQNPTVRIVVFIMTNVYKFLPWGTQYFPFYPKLPHFTLIFVKKSNRKPLR